MRISTEWDEDISKSITRGHNLSVAAKEVGAHD